MIGREEFEDRGAQKVDEALRYTAGVFTQPFGTDSDTDWFYIRGFDATQTGVYLDGLNLYQYGFAGFTIDPSSWSASRCCAAPPRCSTVARTPAASSTRSPSAPRASGCAMSRDR